MMSFGRQWHMQRDEIGLPQQIIQCDGTGAKRRPCLRVEVNHTEGKSLRAFRDCLANPAEAERLGHNGRADVVDQWTWTSALEAIEQYLADATRFHTTDRGE